MTRIKIPLLFLITLFLLFFPIEGQAQSQPNLINIYINETLEFSPTPVYLTATALYSDGSTRDVTFSGTWTTSNPSIASVYRGKVEFGSNTGNVTIEFTFGNLKVAVGTEVVDITDIQITNRNIKYSNTPVQIKVQGRYNHGQLSEVNEHLTWYSVNENVARVDNKGVVTFTGRPGKAFIGVLFTSPLTRQTLQDEITIIVTDDEVRKDEPAPSKPFTIKIDGQLDPSKATNTLKVYRLYADNTRDNLRNDEVSWSSSNPNIATVDNTGRVAFTGRPGSVTIYARYNNRQDSIEAFVPHKTVSLSINETLNFNQGFIATPPRLTVTGKDNSGQTQLLYNVEWSSSNPTVATIDSRGQITFTGRPGTVTFTAQRDNLSDSISTTVSNEQAKNLKTLKIIDNLFYSNSPQNLKALAYYTDGTSTEITKEAQWLSSNENVATVYNGTVYFTGASGQVRITASFEGFSDTVETIVRTPSSKRDLSLIKFQRNHLSYEDNNQSLVLMGIYSDNSSRPLTNVQFYSYHPNIVRIVNNKLIFSGNPGRALVEGTSGNFRDVIEVIVEEPQGINQPLYLQIKGNLDDFQKIKTLEAWAIYPNGDQINVTQQAIWNTTNKNITVLRDKGKVEILGSGPFRISAFYNNHIAYLSNNTYYQFGNLHPIKTNIVSLDGIKTRSIDQLNRNLSLPPLPDISGHWAERDIQLARRLGWMGGYPDGTMGPDRPISRGEFASLVERVLRLNTTSRSLNFRDIDGHWAKESIAIIANLGLVPLDGTGLFRPYDAITRGEMAQILDRLIEVRADRYYPYLDVPPSHPARGAIANVTQGKIMAGVDGLYFKPQDSATRAQALAVLLRLLKSEPEMEGILNRAL